MNTITRSRKAFEDVTAALRYIETFRKSRDFDSLEAAQLNLESALAEDRDYVAAVFYSGLVQELIGKPKDAGDFFKRILAAEIDEPIREETQYNLAVSYYHLYNHSCLEEAEKHFLEVMQTKNQTLRALALANLAQTYAMWMIPTLEQEELLVKGQRPAGVVDQITEKFDRHTQCYNDVQRILDSRGRQKKDEDWTKVEATVKNARGMALMYSIDYGTEDPITKVGRLEDSLKMLQAAEKSAPDDWANTCDLGSAHMRLGVHVDDEAKSEARYVKAIRLLEKVVKQLRPEYGFALYEIGRTYRVWGQFDQAVTYFNRALEVPEEYRDVSRERVEFHRSRAQEGDRRYP